jgi:hypothetical protein
MFGLSFLRWWDISFRYSSGNKRYAYEQNFWNSNFIKFWMLYYGITFLLMLVSLRFCRSQFEIFSLLWLIILYFTLVHSILFVGSGLSGRFRLPIEPYISILAGLSLYRLSCFIKKNLSLKGNIPSF